MSILDLQVLHITEKKFWLPRRSGSWYFHTPVLRTLLSSSGGSGMAVLVVVVIVVPVVAVVIVVLLGGGVGSKGAEAIHTVIQDLLVIL